ncbi:S-adenosyl-L-methionine-dependent methyltransferase [Umbelopsis sp. AD052]|nr:S-adenosyl-L-methionine-dependent methyltransferase [Umbelopsis sp. AD052]
MGASLSRRSRNRSPRGKRTNDQRDTCSHSSISPSVKGTTIQGRVYHDVESSVYFFPMDEIEQDRLHGQHFGLKALFNGNLLAPVRDAVDLENHCHVLDVGCGPGSWLLDLATSHPNSKFVGVDIVDMFPSTIKPPNTEFHVANVLDGLPMFSDNSFDLVQMRLFASVLKGDQWIKTLTELKRVCRPGGMIQLLEVDYKVTGNQFVNKFTSKLVSIMASRGQDGEAAKKLAPMLTQAGFINPHTDHRPIAGGK